jgi:hypothetical protein
MVVKYVIILCKGDGSCGACLDWIGLDFASMIDVKSSNRL